MRFFYNDRSVLLPRIPGIMDLKPLKQARINMESAEQLIEGAQDHGSSLRERILLKAGELFYLHGIHAVGVDRIIKESGVAKMTFYKYFPSKSNLVAAYLASRNESWVQTLKEIAGRDIPAADRILAVFDVLDHAFQMPDFQGCPFIKALAEFGANQGEKAILTNITAHFKETEAAISGLVNQMGLTSEIAQNTISLIFGSIIVAQSIGNLNIARVNKEAVRILLSQGSSYAASHT